MTSKFNSYDKNGHETIHDYGDVFELKNLHVTADVFVLTKTYLHKFKTEQH